ncbi:MAG: hypothetical protein KCHDKBKB_01216 [Elusimicrobia bacterium]|nr:hypothetical protein [Elusimicrobiota bacterium]
MRKLNRRFQLTKLYHLSMMDIFVPSSRHVVWPGSRFYVTEEPGPRPKDRRGDGPTEKFGFKKLLLRILLGSGALFMLSNSTIFAGSTGTLTVSVTPNAYYAVVIDTSNVSLNLGTVDLGASTQTVRPSTVSIQSTFATTDLKLQGFISSAGTAWSFDNDTTSVEPDNLAAWATFTSVARSSAPTQTGGYFSGTQSGVNNSDVISNSDRYVGTQAGLTNLFEADSGDFAFKDMDALPPEPDSNAKSHLWLYFRLPNATTTSNAQNISITITAVAPD